MANDMLHEMALGIKRFWGLRWRVKGPILGGFAFVALTIFGAALGSGSDDKAAPVLAATSTPSATRTAAPSTVTPLVTSTPTASPEPTLSPTPVATPTPTPYVPPATPYVPPATPYVAPPTPYVPPVPVTTPVPHNPYTGATAICRDGSISYSAHRSGTCSHHGGVAQWCPCNAP